jgi:hypothetical protein
MPVANCIIELTPLGMIDCRKTAFDEYLADPALKTRRALLYPRA